LARNSNANENELAELPLDSLPPRRRAFVEEYLVDLNATQAAIRAGYSPRTAQEISSELLSNPLVAAAVERGKAQRLARVGMSQDQVLQEMALLSHSSVSHYEIDDRGQVQPAPGAPDGCMRAIQSIKKKTTVKVDGSITYDVELRLWSKPEPLKLMGKHVGLNFSDRIEHVGPGGGPIITEVRNTIVDPKKDGDA
jgi:phage terminase small subunit